ncbi:(2Fe-2S)-binding protein [Moorella naiadis]|uniref:(2Fe-2S)-binding protein n=1 Tax=Moorella naiadis (nom. illeg.) TaxID=3093670 RepID=UPI003D9C8612
MRVWEHPILGGLTLDHTVTIWVDGRPVEAREGEPVAAALLANGIRVCRYTPKRHEPRGIFCGTGQCADCLMQVDGIPNVRTCITPVREGMDIRTQEGLGKWGDDHGEH